VLVYGAKFGVLVLALYLVLAVPTAEDVLYDYLKANAWVSNLILDMLGQGTQVTDVTIRSPNFAIAIKRGCDAVEPTWLLCAAIMAFPGPWRRKLAGIGIGSVALQALNLIRIVTLYWIGSRLPAFFLPAHLEIWPAVFIIAAILLFVGWKGWAYEK
jgi:exosortase/archaeosortase family protein